ncbi:MAG: ribonuclease III [Proteobacteria bacterium]|nr:ribonuclease III [Pseudomonadota bacterium]
MAASRRPLSEAGPLDESLRGLEAVLGHCFADPLLLSAACSHSSIPRRSGGEDGAAFDRLEFLGDRVVGLVVAEILFRRFPHEAEGDLARRHAALVSREMLAAIAQALDLGRYLRFAAGQEEASLRRNRAVLADALEAVIAALYLDGGLAAARRFIVAQIEPRLRADAAPPQDAKTALQEWAQARGKKLPTYATLAVAGPAHLPQFAVEVQVEGCGAEIGRGSSKRAAEQAAAQALLGRLQPG